MEDRIRARIAELQEELNRLSTLCAQYAAAIGELQALITEPQVATIETEKLETIEL